MDSYFSMININDLINNPCEKKCEDKGELKTLKKSEKYNQNTYNANFMMKHKDKVKERIECEICGGSYTYYNKSTHNKSIRHNKMKQRLNM